VCVQVQLVGCELICVNQLHGRYSILSLCIKNPTRAGWGLSESFLYVYFIFIFGSGLQVHSVTKRRYALGTEIC